VKHQSLLDIINSLCVIPLHLSQQWKGGLVVSVLFCTKSDGSSYLAFHVIDEMKDGSVLVINMVNKEVFW
jgi:hypothetical protein